MHENSSISRLIENQENVVWRNHKHLSDNAHTTNDLNLWNENRGLNQALGVLPTFKYKSLKDVAEVNENQDVLDLGSGDNAVALSELAEATGINGTGVTLPLDREGVQHPENVAVVRVDIREFLRSAAANTYDIIYSVQSWRYLADPLATLKLAYRALKPNGVLMVDFIFHRAVPVLNNRGEIVPPKELEKKIIKAGIEVEITEKMSGVGGFMGYSLSLRKSTEQSSLSLPVKIIDVNNFPELASEVKKNPNDRENDDYLYVHQDLKYVYQLEE